MSHTISLYFIRKSGFLQEKTCEESTSFDLTPYDVASAIAAVDRLLVEQVKDASFGPALTEEFNSDYSG